MAGKDFSIWQIGDIRKGSAGVRDSQKLFLDFQILKPGSQDPSNLKIYIAVCKADLALTPMLFSI